MNYRRQHLKTNIYSITWSTSYKVSLKAKTNCKNDIRTYWMFRDAMAVINGVLITGRPVVIPGVLQQEALKQLHINHMGTKILNFWQLNLFIG